MPAARVEPGRRLVEKEDRRPCDQRRGEVEPPPHAARVGADEPAAGVREAEALEQLARRGRARLALREVVEAADHLQVLGAGQVLVDGRVLAGEADLAAAAGAALRRDVEPRDARGAAVGASAAS